MTKHTIVAITFQDLSDAAAVLSSGSASPKEIRQNFARFIDASQRLTSHMRKESKDWVPGDFGDWNAVTELFKELRNVDQHEQPITILVRETQYFRTYEGSPDEVAFAGTWSFSLEDQLNDTPRDDVRLVLADPKTGKPTGETVAPVRKEYEFHITPTPSPKARELLASIGDTNVRTLSERCFKVLIKYYQAYQHHLGQS
jgi:hypothetical protein